MNLAKPMTTIPIISTTLPFVSRIWTGETGKRFCKNKRINKLLDEVGAEKGEELIQTLYEHWHPYHAHFDCVFETESERDAMFHLLSPYFQRHGLELRTYSAHLCDGNCGDYLDTADTLYWNNGWIYCESCLDSGNFGEWDLDQLLRELEYYEKYPEKLQPIIHERSADYERYKQVIRRSCRIHNMDFPAWAID